MTLISLCHLHYHNTKTGIRTELISLACWKLNRELEEQKLLPSFQGQLALLLLCIHNFFYSKLNQQTQKPGKSIWNCNGKLK